MKLLLVLALLIPSIGSAALLNLATKILSAATTTATGTSYTLNGPQATFQCYGTTSAGAGASAIIIEVSDATAPSTTAVDWVTAGTISLTLGTTQTNDGFAINAPWRWARARVSSISGTNGTVSCWMSKAGTP